jgi:hypothetical protein
MFFLLYLYYSFDIVVTLLLRNKFFNALLKGHTPNICSTVSITVLFSFIIVLIAPYRKVRASGVRERHTLVLAS